MEKHSRYLQLFLCQKSYMSRKVFENIKTTQKFINGVTIDFHLSSSIGNQQTRKGDISHSSDFCLGYRWEASLPWYPWRQRVLYHQVSTRCLVYFGDTFGFFNSQSNKKAISIKSKIKILLAKQTVVFF